MALRAEIVEFSRLRLLHQPNQVRRVRQVPVMQGEGPACFVQVVIEMVDSVGVEGGSPALDTVDRVSLAEQQLGKECAILAGRAGNQGNLFRHPSSTSKPRYAALRLIYRVFGVFREKCRKIAEHALRDDVDRELARRAMPGLRDALQPLAIGHETAQLPGEAVVGVR